MFTAQLALFLINHHHAHWAAILTSCPPHRFAHIFAWAVRHGFRFQS